MEMFGYYGGPTRSPLQPLNDSQLNQLKQIFSAFDGFDSWAQAVFNGITQGFHKGPAFKTFVWKLEK